MIDDNTINLRLNCKKSNREILSLIEKDSILTLQVCFCIITILQVSENSKNK